MTTGRRGLRVMRWMIPGRAVATGNDGAVRAKSA
jgi:hypothetical protein